MGRAPRERALQLHLAPQQWGLIGPQAPRWSPLSEGVWHLNDEGLALGSFFSFGGVGFCFPVGMASVNPPDCHPAVNEMVCCTGSWPPIQQIKRDAFPSILSFLCCLFPWYGLPCFLVNTPSPPPPPCQRRLFLSGGETRKPQREMRLVWGGERPG